MFETFEHTADLGLRARAADLDALFVEMARALFSAVVEDLDAIRPEQKVDVRIEGDDREFLLFDWLNELLYQHDTQHFVFGRFEVRVGKTRLEGSAWGEPSDPARHGVGHEVKAITY